MALRIPKKLADLRDVSALLPLDGYLLRYDGGAGKWGPAGALPLVQPAFAIADRSGNGRDGVGGANMSMTAGRAPGTAGFRTGFSLVAGSYGSVCNIPDDAYSRPSSSTPWSVEVWFHGKSSTTVASFVFNLISSRGAAANSGPDVFVQNDALTARFYCQNNAYVQAVTAAGIAALTSTGWNQVVVTYSGTWESGAIAIYLNGAALSVTPSTSGTKADPFTYQSYGIHLGNRANGTAPWQGWRVGNPQPLDLFGWWSGTALSPAQVTAHWSGGAGTLALLVADAPSVLYGAYADTSAVTIDAAARTNGAQGFTILGSDGRAALDVDDFGNVYVRGAIYSRAGLLGLGSDAQGQYLYNDQGGYLVMDRYFRAALIGTISGGYSAADGTFKATNSNTPAKLTGHASDGASAVGVIIDNDVTLAAAGTKSLSVRNNTLEKFYVDKDGYVVSAGAPAGRRVAAPASAGAAGLPGDFAADASWAYFCTATNTWVRAAAATW
jgi:hypothetical protein